MKVARLFALIAALALVGAGAPDPLAVPAGSNWPSDGRDYSAQRYSPLTQINAGNVSKLGLAWYDELGTYKRESAPPPGTPVMLYGMASGSAPEGVKSGKDAKVSVTFDDSNRM